MKVQVEVPCGRRTGPVYGTSTSYNYHKCRCDECKEWKKAVGRAYYERNRDVVKARNNAYYHANRDVQRERRRAYYEANPDKEKARRQFWLQYQKDHPEEVNAKNRRWRRNNPSKAWFITWNQREKRRGQEYAPETLEWIKTIREQTCTYCGAPAETVDHILPRSKGGSNDRENLAAACHPCNRRKSTVPVDVFIRRLREE